VGDPDIDGKIILKWIVRKWSVGFMDWIEVAQKMARWRALVTAVMNLRVS
jgi:ribosomal protein S4E